MICICLVTNEQDTVIQQCTFDNPSLRFFTGTMRGVRHRHLRKTQTELSVSIARTRADQLLGEWRVVEDCEECAEQFVTPGGWGGVHGWRTTLLPVLNGLCNGVKKHFYMFTYIFPTYVLQRENSVCTVPYPVL